MDKETVQRATNAGNVQQNAKTEILCHCAWVGAERCQVGNDFVNVASQTMGGLRYRLGMTQFYICSQLILINANSWKNIESSHAVINPING